MDYYFEMVQKLKFSVYDVDNETCSLGDDDALGDMECNLGQVNLLCCYVALRLSNVMKNFR